MGEKITDNYLIKITEDLSTIRVTVSTLQNQLERFEEKVVDPFQEWLHNVKAHEADIKKLKEDLSAFAIKIKQTEDSILSLDKAHGKEIVDISHRIDLAKWYGMGATASLGFVCFVVYKLLTMFLPFLK